MPQPSRNTPTAAPPRRLGCFAYPGGKPAISKHSITTIAAAFTAGALIAGAATFGAISTAAPAAPAAPTTTTPSIVQHYWNVGPYTSAH